MPILKLKISRRWARMLTMLGAHVKGGGDLRTPTDVVEHILEMIDCGVFMPDSDLRPLVQELFGSGWESSLVPDTKAEHLVRFRGPRSLCADVPDEDLESVIVYRHREEEDPPIPASTGGSEHDGPLERVTVDGLTRWRFQEFPLERGAAHTMRRPSDKDHSRKRIQSIYAGHGRAHTPGQLLVYHTHDCPKLARWLLADRRAEQAGAPSPDIPQAVQDEWEGIYDTHCIIDDSESLPECGLPVSPERDVRGEPFWR